MIAKSRSTVWEKKMKDMNWAIGEAKRPFRSSLLFLLYTFLTLTLRPAAIRIIQLEQGSNIVMIFLCGCVVEVESGCGPGKLSFGGLTHRLFLA